MTKDRKKGPRFSRNEAAVLFDGLGQQSSLSSIVMSEEIVSIHAVLVDQLKDLYSAETLIAKALPKMAKAAKSAELKAGFKHHLAQTKVHAERLKSICASLQEKPTGKTCQATVGLLKEGDEAMEEDALPEMKDLMLIAAARRTEHYEMSGYLSASGLAKALGLKEAVKTLAATLAEEKTMDATLSKLTTTALSKAFTAEKTAKPAQHELVVEEVGKTIKKVVKTITG